MSIPAHVHLDPHPCDTGDEDVYEVDIAGAGNGILNCNEQVFFPGPYTEYDAETALSSGNFIDPYTFDEANPIRYLFYFNAQVSDHFASQDWGGDNDLGNNPYLGMQEYLNSLGQPIPQGQVNVTQTANILMNLTIRSTASLLYWFAKEADLLKAITVTTNRPEDFVQIRNPALSIDPNSQYYWQLTPYTLKFDNSITLDLMADPWAEQEEYAFINWEKRNKNNVKIGGYSNLEWLNANATATSTFVANYAPLVTVSFNPIQIESQNANAYYKNLTTGEISSSFTFPQGYPITVEAVAPLDYLFLGWSDVNGFIGGPNPASFNPTSSISGYYATFKKMNSSGDPNAYANNNQRKFIRNHTGVLFSVYSSMEKVWIEYSTNNGSTWELGNEKRPLFQGLDAKNPSIEIWNYDFGKTYLLVIAQVNIDGEADIRISRLTWDPSHYTFMEWNHIPFDEQSVFWPFPYSETNLKPVIGMISPGRILIAVDMLELGKTIWFQAGELSYNSYINWFQDYWITSQNTLSNVSMYSTKLDFDISQGDEYVCWIAYEEIIGSSSPRIMVTKAYMTSYGGFDLTTPIILSENNGFTKNYKPSVTAWLEGEDNHCAAVIWTAFRKTAPDAPIGNPGEGNDPGDSQSLGETKVFFRSYSNGIWSQPRSYGNNINSLHINKNTNNSFAFAWSEGTTNVNRYVKSSNITTIYTTNTIGKYLQVGNFANLNAMRLNSFKTSSLPYLFQLSNTFGNINEEDLNTDRFGVVVKDTTAFYFSIGNIKVNDQSVDFIEVPDSLIISDKETLNAYLLSNPFNLSDESNFIYSIKFGVTDSVSAANTLIDNKSVHFQVRLIDDQTGEILGTLDDVIFSAQNIVPYENVAYQVNTQGIGNRTCRLKLVTDDNISFNYSVIDNRDNDTTLAKKGFIEKFINSGEIVKTYELTQNYPNPFNPSTKIM